MERMIAADANQSSVSNFPSDIASLITKIVPSVVSSTPAPPNPVVVPTKTETNANEKEQKQEQPL
jgi:hypothetical protein